MGSPKRSQYLAAPAADTANEHWLESDDDDPNPRLRRVPPQHADVALVGSYRRPSFTFGQSRPTFVPASPLATAINTLTATERDTMLEQEQDLLRDNRRIPNYGTTRGHRRASVSSQDSITDLGPPAFPELPDDERTSLLKATGPQWEQAIDAGAIHTTYLREFKVIAKSAAPLYITFALQYSLTISSIFAAGTIGKTELAGVSLGGMTATITGYAIYQGKPIWRKSYHLSNGNQGLTTALDTLCAQGL